MNINDYAPAASSDTVPVSAGVGVAAVVIVLIIVVALVVGIVACMKRRRSDQNDPCKCSYLKNRYLVNFYPVCKYIYTCTILYISHSYI